MEAISKTKVAWGKVRSTVFRWFSFAVRGVVLVAIGCSLYVNLRSLWPIVHNEISFIAHLPGLSYDKKMSAQWGLYYDYMAFVRENTPSDAVIMTPPQAWPWSKAGNRHLSLYFLYPRRTKEGGIDGPMVDEAATHVMIVWGFHKPENPRDYGWAKRWPEPPYPPGKVIYMPGEMGRWGLIDLRGNR